MVVRLTAGAVACIFVFLSVVACERAWSQGGPVDSGFVFGHGFERGPTTVDDLEVSDCLVLADDDYFADDVKIVACDAPHQMEVFATYEFDDPTADYPGNNELVRSAYRDCQAWFENYVGVGFWDSVYDITTITPSPSTWVDGDREVVCLIVDIDGELLTSPARGSRR